MSVPAGVCVLCVVCDVGLDSDVVRWGSMKRSAMDSGGDLDLDCGKARSPPLGKLPPAPALPLAIPLTPPGGLVPVVMRDDL